MKKLFCLNFYLIGLFLFACQNIIQAQDKIHLKDGTEVSCRITEIKDFILYAEVHDDTFLATFFADDVSHLDIDPNNSNVIRQLKKGVREAMQFANPLEDNQLYGFYFGMPYDSVHKNSSNTYENDSLGNPILIPYDPLNTDFPVRIKSVMQSITGKSLTKLLSEF